MLISSEQNSSQIVILNKKVSLLSDRLSDVVDIFGKVLAAGDEKLNARVAALELDMCAMSKDLLILTSQQSECMGEIDQVTPPTSVQGCYFTKQELAEMKSRLQAKIDLEKKWEQRHNS